MSSYVPTTPADREAMLAAIGVESIEDLFRDVPAPVRMQRPLDLPAGESEQEVFEALRALAAKNVSTDDEISFLGGGMYDHYIPSVVDMLVERSEFLTPYTPYQPEISQGGLQVMFEYQTAISELTGLPVSNASVYDGPSAVGAAAYLAKLSTKDRDRLVVSAGVHPHSRATLRTMAVGYEMETVEVALRDGVTDPDALAAALDDRTAAVFVQQPNVLGAVEDLAALAGPITDAGALAIAACDPIALSVLRTPGECGFQLAVGEGQPLGNRLDFGGPSFGFFAADEKFIRRMPGRIAGETTDVDGRRGFVLTLQTREQHIRREKATSNICTAQALNALAGMAHLAWLGRAGFAELGELLLQRTAYAREQLAQIDGVELAHSQPVVREFALRLDGDPARIADRCAAAGVNPGWPIGRDDPELSDILVVALTERRTREHIDRLVDVLATALADERAGEPMPAIVSATHEVLA